MKKEEEHKKAFRKAFRKALLHFISNPCTRWITKEMKLSKRVYTKIQGFGPKPKRKHIHISFANKAKQKKTTSVQRNIDSQSHPRKLKSKPRASKCSSQTSSSKPVKPHEKKE